MIMGECKFCGIEIFDFELDEKECFKIDGEYICSDWLCLKSYMRELER